MGKITGFIDFPREIAKNKQVEERIKNFEEFTIPLPTERIRTQAARCMDCGTPFCSWGCPISNLIPEFNEHIYRKDWQSAYVTLKRTNDFPEFTGRVCPAPCESSCCSGVVTEPITIKQIELSIIENAFEQDFVKPIITNFRTDKKIAVIGSGPAGLTAARKLNLAGHRVTVFEKNEVLGGLLALGIPDYKLEKWVIERRIEIMKKEEIEFRTNAHIGKNVSTDELINNFDAICLTGGSEHPRDLPVPGREKKGIHFALDFLTQQNRRNGGRSFDGEEISAKGKNVVVIGGGDTGSDCIGTSIRQGAKSVIQLEILPKPPLERAPNNPWPHWPNTFKTSSAQEEGGTREFLVNTKEFVGKDAVEKLICVRVEWSQNESGQWNFKEIPDSEFEIQADLVLLAMGFVHPIHEGMLKDFGVAIDERGNVKVDNYQTSVKNIFAAGDMATGQSLVVRAIASGRAMAKALDRHLQGNSYLPS